MSNYFLWDLTYKKVFNIKHVKSANNWSHIFIKPMNKHNLSVFVKIFFFFLLVKSIIKKLSIRKFLVFTFDEFKKLNLSSWNWMFLGGYKNLSIKKCLIFTFDEIKNLNSLNWNHFCFKFYNCSSFWLYETIKFTMEYFSNSC